ncbi:hypothetical protein DSM104443_00849 [Usitatibacter rugosus]|uniref:Mechanosensitive ion channel-like protein n=1 Tax=Usitatibacter rugosus TaxID=2732067 RepID=A0A6M4GR28_9PROT|nr:mechanosensitive ion channel domain-containing protein [Usitatibacter rugosus]QJR09799.1 hypothetical protein DSM104443_00849 [Usitatibacter rugosus]
MNEIEKLIEEFGTRQSLVPFFLGVVVIAAALAISVLVTRRLRKRLATHPHRWANNSDFPGFAGPLVAVAIVWIARFAVQRTHWLEHTPLLDLAIPLLVALAVIRFALYVLASVLPQGSLLSGSQRTISWLIWIGVALYFTGLLPEVEEALDDVVIPIGKDRFTLLLAIRAVFSVAVTLAVTLWIANVIEGRLQKAEHLQVSTRAVMGKFVRAMAVLLAILIALPLVGVDVTALSVFGGAIGVGLGFGMQKIASNYVSGFIILLDRSVRIGDLVTVDNRQGTVQEIASRYTVVKAGDGTQSIIPNETLITQTVINHTYSNRRAVVKVQASVPYDTDLDIALGILRSAGETHPLALKDPAPAAVILKIGDPGVDLELSIWIDDVFANAAQIRTDLLRAILAGFREHGIRIPAVRREWVGFATPEMQERPSESKA